MKQASQLKSFLNSIDHKGYPAYKGAKGSYSFGNYELWIDHVQGDPFASPSRVHVTVPGKTAGFPADYYKEYHCRTALSDYLIRTFGAALDRCSFKAKGSGKSGLIAISHCGQQILERSACIIHPKNGDISMSFSIGFPANGRSINARELIKILFQFLPECVEEALYYKNCKKKTLEQVIFLAEDQKALRDQISFAGLTAFVANGSILPRQSGISQKPMKGAVSFQSPASYEVSFTLPHKGTITGMGIPKGITLIVGGGYHGKSTLLKALETGVYNHIAGDGREFVATDPSAMKIRAEDGRCIKKTDISLFIKDLPNKKDTQAFTTEDASGSTSQAANVIEAMESGSSLFLIDEDTSATNFMIRDELMQRVVHRSKEPITPFIDRVRDLYEISGISSIIVAGSSGSYFHVADHILQMDQYVPYDITKEAKEAAKDFPVCSSKPSSYETPDFKRCFAPSKAILHNQRQKLKTLGIDAFSINRETVDLRYLEQLVDAEQTTALSYCLLYLHTKLLNGNRTLREAVDLLYAQIEAQGIGSILNGSYISSNLALPRRQEIYGCSNRYRG